MVTKTILYSYWRSSCSWRVRIALNLKKIDYEYRTVNITTGEQKEAKFSDLNPMNMVPTLVHDGHIISQSLAALEYLDEVVPDKSPLVSGSASQKALIRQLALLIIADIQPLQNPSVSRFHSEGDDAKIQPWSSHFIERGFDALEKSLQQTAGKYCVGDKLTLVDLCLPPQVFNANRFNVDLSKYPTITRINENLAQIDEFKRAHAFAQPDAPEKQSK